MPTTTPLFLLASLLLAQSTFAANWPQFRGPRASGVDDSSPAPTEWNVESGKNILWKTEVPGLAHASPILWSNRLYIATVVAPNPVELKVGLYGDIDAANDQESQQWRLLSLDAASGGIVWNKLGHEGVPKVKRHTKASHCNSTPATDGKRIVAIFGSEGLFCFDMQGALLWKKDLGPMDAGYFRTATAQWGFASSPVLHDGKVIVQCDVQTNSFLAAFDALDGKELWRTARTDVPSWSTPTITDVGNATHVLVNGWHHSGAYDFTTGKEIWRHDGGGDIPTPTPITADGIVFLTSGHGRFRPMQAIRLDAKGIITASELGGTNQFIVWSHTRKGNYMQTPILAGGLLFACYDNGVLTCFEPKTGKVHYEERLDTGGDGFTASPVSDGRNLYFASEQGMIYVVPVAQSFSVARKYPMQETVMASPALTSGKLYVRTRNHVIAIGSRN